jgi:drug/metabolite transporter (DMT)-like permease
MKPILFALAAILLWSSLALAGAGLTRIPPFLLLAVAFCVSGLIGVLRPRGWRIPWVTLTVGTVGIFGYHFLYFLAFAQAPAVEVNLLNYLWPLLIVVLSPLLLAGYRLRPRHVLGALLGLCGAGLIATGGKLNLDLHYLPGYLLAVGAAVTWALYSLLTKRLPPFPTESVGAFCLLSGLLSALFYFLSGGTFAVVQSLSWQDWTTLALLGLGPMGAAFFFWDAAIKRGDPRVIGSLAYLTPLLSTLNLVVFAGKRLNALSFAAMVLIVLGAVLGSLEMPKS